jgi:hypothetical protein
MDDILRQLATKRAEVIAAHDELRSKYPFVSQSKRLNRLTAGLAFGLQSIWLMSRRAGIYDDFLTFRFFDDTIQSGIAIWSLAKEGQISPAKREMRYLLESCAKHVYVDLRLMGKPIGEKLSFLKNEVPYSSVSFVDNFRLYQFSDHENKQFMDTIRHTYTLLCRYVHRSPQQIEEALRLLQQGISPGLETAKEIESLCRQLAQLYDLVLVMHFNALGVGLSGDVFTTVLDSSAKWPFHKTKFVKLLSSYFDYKQERRMS